MHRSKAEPRIGGRKRGLSLLLMVAAFFFGSLTPLHLFYAMLSLTVVRMLPVAIV